MPKKEIDYLNTIMYKLVCNNLQITDCYAGHTTDFTDRKYSHKIRCVNPNNAKYHLKVYVFIREHGGWDNWSMIEIEKYPCNDNNEARSRERYWYEQLKSNLNTYCPHRSNAQYHKDNAENYRENASKYYNENKTIILGKKKQYRQDNLEIVREKNNLYSETYRENNKKQQKRKTRNIIYTRGI